MHILALFTLFCHYFRSATNIPYNKKAQKPLYYLRFRVLLFFPIKTDNPLILYIHLSLLLSQKSVFLFLYFCPFLIKLSPFMLRKALQNKGLKGGLEFLIIRANFASTYTFTLVKWVFFGLFSLPQNPKMASCKGYKLLRRSKKAKKNVLIADFSKIDAP